MEVDQSKLMIRAAYSDEWETAMGLAWKTFLRFEADDYSEEGINSFQDFITDQSLRRVFLNGEYQLFVAIYRNEMIGLISLRDRTHISLLFVDEAFHNQGVGKNLIEYLKHYMFTEMGEFHVTVNSSPYAVGFYHKVGFKDTAIELTKDGIRYTPMICVFPN